MTGGDGADGAADITVELRLSSEALARRISGWLEKSEVFAVGAAKGSGSVLIADHIPDDADGPIVLLAKEDGLVAWPGDPRVAARLDPDIDPVRLRIAVEAAAYGLSIGKGTGKRGSGAEAQAGLTSRELEVLRHVAIGASNKVIARALGISSHTVKFHVAAILEKLGAASRTEAALHAIRLGLFLA